MIRSPLHDNQESTSQIRLEKLFDQGSLTVSYLDGEPTTADPYNNGDDIEYNYSNKIGKRITFENI